MGPFDTLQTSRLTLRRWRSDDRAVFAEMNADPEVMKYFPGVLDQAASDELVDQIEACFATAGFGLWAVEVRRSGNFIGFTGLSPMQTGVPGEGGTEIGWRLTRSAWHQGYATEAAAAVAQLAFGELGLGEIWSLTTSTNSPSRAVMTRLGMTLHAEFAHPRIPAESLLQPAVVYHRSSPKAD